MNVDLIFASSDDVLSAFTSFLFTSYTYMFGLMVAWYLGSKLINTVLNGIRGHKIV